MGWSGEAGKAIQTNHHIRFSTPDEGSQVFFECLAISSKCKNKDAAEKFIDLLYNPKISSEVSNYSYYATLNMEAKAFISRDILNGPSYFIPNIQDETVFIRKSLGDDEHLYFDIWADVMDYYKKNIVPKISKDHNLDISYDLEAH